MGDFHPNFHALISLARHERGRPGIPPWQSSDTSSTTVPGYNTRFTPDLPTVSVLPKTRILGKTGYIHTGHQPGLGLDCRLSAQPGVPHLSRPSSPWIRR